MAYKNLLIDELRSEQDKKEDLFSINSAIDTYKTGIAPLDYALGYIVKVYNQDNTVEEEYNALGISGGCNIMWIGKSSTAKTSSALLIAANIVRPYQNGTIIHFDLEQAMNISRARTMTKFTAEEMKGGKYVLRQADTSVEKIKRTIIQLYKVKKDNPDKYMYHTGKKNEFGEEIVVYEPTVVLIDSIPSMSVELNENDKKDFKKIEEITSQTDRMRLTGEIGRFYTDLLPYIRSVNIIIISINHIKVNPQMGIVKSPAELLYLKQDEALPGGKTPVYLAHILLKSVAIGSEKYTYEDDGFDGFGINVEIIKSRSNQAGQKVKIIYDKVRGVDPVRTCIAYAKDNGLIGGNKNSMYFVNHKENKFPLKTVNEFFMEHRELYKIMYEEILPSLKSKLSSVSEEQLQVVDELMDY